MKRINHQAIKMLEKSIGALKREEKFYGANPEMLRILTSRQKVMEYLLRLCKEKQNDK